MAKISIIVAIANNGALGANNDLLWRLPNDLKRFKQITAGHTVVMGRKTFESLPKGALPNRTNVVITRNSHASFDGCEIFDNLPDAINKHQQEEEVFIIGGAQIYEQTIAFADKLYITCVHHTFEEADVFFPEINENDWETVESIAYSSDGNHPYPYTFKIFLRKKNSDK
jgi:dihydrofolate reductase